MAPNSQQFVTEAQRARWQEIIDDLPRLQALPLLKRLRDRGPAMKNVPLFAVELMEQAAAEIERLDTAILKIVSQDGTVSICDGRVTVTHDATLTDDEREVIRILAAVFPSEKYAATLRNLLERLT